MLWAISAYFFPVGLLLLLMAYFIPLFTYISIRNQTVPEDQKVMTPYHLGEVVNDMLAKMGVRPLFNKSETGIDRAGPPINFVGKGQGGKVDNDRVQKAEQSRVFMGAKELVYDAILRRATDIHLEPTEEQMSVRYRIDGILHTAEPFDRPTGDAVVNVIKVLSAMDISEKRKPQDGSFGAKLEGREVDFRVATAGSKTGEKLVMRILDNAASVGRLDEIGLRAKMVQSIRDLVNQPHGMFLCCGPTGSGKSTTLYAALREIDRFQKNVITIEDPIEYHIDNISQIEINQKAGQTFSATLRSVLRQDPDVIMVGEIRDQETATIACQAANTGHLVFSTVHSNDAITALFRLLDLGVEPFMIASALTAVLGQRLVRVLCEDCKEPYKPKPEFLEKANLPAEKVDVFYRPPENPAAGLPHLRRHRLRGPNRHLRAAGDHRPDPGADPREPVAQRDQGRSPPQRHDLSPGGRAPPGHPGPNLHQGTAARREDDEEPLMPPVIIDIVTLVLILGMTYALASEGLWGAALQFFNALFAGIIAFNFYEPMAAAGRLERQRPGRLRRRRVSAGPVLDQPGALASYNRLDRTHHGPLPRPDLPHRPLDLRLTGRQRHHGHPAAGFPHSARAQENVLWRVSLRQEAALRHGHSTGSGSGFFQYTTGYVFSRNNPNEPRRPVRRIRQRPRLRPSRPLADRPPERPSLRRWLRPRRQLGFRRRCWRCPGSSSRRCRRRWQARSRHSRRHGRCRRRSGTDERF